MKKKISVVLVVLGCAWALAGCGPKESEKTSATTAATTTAATTVETTVETSASKALDAGTDPSDEEGASSEGASIVVQESEIVIEIDPSDLVDGQSQVISQTIEVKAGDL